MRPAPTPGSCTVVLATALITWWTTRDLPASTGPVVRAALRTDRSLLVTYAGIATCVLIFVGVAVTGIGALAAVAWLVLGLLAGLALGVRLVRQRRNQRARPR